MARDIRRNGTRLNATNLTLLVALAISLLCESGCGNPPVPGVRPQAPESEPIENAVQSEVGETSQKEAAKTASPQADAKPAEPPLDPTVEVDRLLAMRLPSEDLTVGWIRLFDGQSMMGWRNAGNANWKVEDGALVASEGEPGLLCTSVRFSDFELMLEYKGTDTTNSGIFLRTPTVPKDPAKDCFELNIAPPSNPFPTGSLVGRVKVGEQVDEPEYNDTTNLANGLIGLQFRESSIKFRNIRIRPITYAILPAKDLKDFNEPAGNIQAELSDAGSLTLTGGKGHLELLQPHANCCIQFAAQTLAENVNSGLFFRCIPGEDMNGYECQVHHGFKEDRRRPEDAGMGAIFRRQNAKAVLSDANEKAYVTIIADGPAMSTWVNGVQVVDWEDTRSPNANPRKGLRLEAGTIMLQGHDPTCKVRFDSLSICPLP